MTQKKKIITWTRQLICIWLLPLYFTPFPLTSQNSILNLNYCKWKFRSLDENKLYPATVPGTIHLDLFNNKLIENPFHADNEKQLKWVSEKTWMYETNFNLDKEQLQFQRINLIFEGLDTYTKVIFNNDTILETDNMFLKYEIEISKKTKIGENSLKIIFLPSKEKAKNSAKQLSYQLPGEERVFARKAQYNFGWDWAPELITCGIWKNCNILFENDSKIIDVQFIQNELKKEEAKTQFKITLDNFNKSEKYNVELQLSGKNFTFNSTAQLPTSDNSIIFSASIANPQIWWCNEKGEQNFYLAKVSLKKGDKIIQEKNLRIGLREIELCKEKDSFGNEFSFKLNNEKIFIKGANLVPLDVFLPIIKPEEYKKLIQYAVDGHFNMIRVWGGGIYEDDKLYNLCDEKGILVWQDFIFACGMYPGDTSFLRSIENEIEQQVIRLRNHPCLAMWCGNNENIEGWYNWGWQKQFQYSMQDSTEIIKNYQKLFEKLIPNKLKKLDPNRAYHPSSPSNGWGRKESYLKDDVHYWGVWWGMEPFESYEKNTGRFVSEYGFQSLPSYQNLKKFIPKKDLSLDSESMKTHQKHPTGFQTISEYISRYYPIPKNVEDYSFISQLLQADAMEMAIHAHRKKMPYCMGSLFWQFNDCWPSISWSCIDHYGEAKASYFRIKESFKNTILHLEKNKNNIVFYAINETYENLNSILKIEILNFKGEVLKKYSSTVSLAKNTSNSIYQIALEDLPKNTDDYFIKSTLVFKEKVLDIDYYYFNLPKDLKLLRSVIQLKKTSDNTLLVTCSNALAKNIYLSHPNLEFEENYFDLLPGETKIIKVSGSSKWTTNSIKIKTLNEFFKNE